MRVVQNHLVLSLLMNMLYTYIQLMLSQTEKENVSRIQLGEVDSLKRGRSINQAKNPINEHNYQVLPPKSLSQNEIMFVHSEQ